MNPNAPAARATVTPTVTVHIGECLIELAHQMNAPKSNIIETGETHVCQCL